MNKGYFKPVSESIAAMRAEERAPDEQRQILFTGDPLRNDCVVNLQASENIRDAWIAGTVWPIAAVNTATNRRWLASIRCGRSKCSIVETIFYDGKRLFQCEEKSLLGW